MSGLLISFGVLLTAYCSGQDYSIKESMVQTITAEKINYLIIECYCDSGVWIQEFETNTIEIKITGILSSVGYHGLQEKPPKIGEKTLSFKPVINKDTLRLLSREWTFMHHAYLIDHLRIKIPKKLRYEIINIQGSQLEGREIEGNLLL